MSGGTGDFLLEKAEAFALRIVRLYQHLSENSAIHTSYFILHTSRYALVIGLFCGRWVQLALVEADCGLMVG